MGGFFDSKRTGLFKYVMRVPIVGSAYSKKLVKRREVVQTGCLRKQLCFPFVETCQLRDAQCWEIGRAQPKKLKLPIEQWFQLMLVL